MKFKKVLTIILILLGIFAISTKVNAVTLVLDAGHGGHDNGAISGNLLEKTLNLKVTQYLKQYLEEYENINVILTRNNDTFLEIFDRSMVARSQKADFMISLHFNSSESASLHGAEVFVTNNIKDNTLKVELSECIKESLFLFFIYVLSNISIYILH